MTAGNVVVGCYVLMLWALIVIGLMVSGWGAELRVWWRQSKQRRRLHEWWLIVTDPRRAAWRVIYLGPPSCYSPQSTKSCRLGYMDARQRAKIFEPAIVVFDPGKDG